MRRSNRTTEEIAKLAQRLYKLHTEPLLLLTFPELGQAYKMSAGYAYQIVQKYKRGDYDDILGIDPKDR